MPANAGVDNGRARRFNGLRQLYRFGKSPAVFDQVEHRQSVDNNEVVADAFAHRTHYFYGKSHPVAVIAAPLGYFAAFLMYGFGNGAMVWDLAGVIEHCTAFHANAC
uniref:Uncharacterized protein n=1 Tax=Panagrolaimus superbus TaxID=310955 RepID=A0A914YT15_9BILA